MSATRLRPAQPVRTAPNTPQKPAPRALAALRRVFRGCGPALAALAAGLAALCLFWWARGNRQWMDRFIRVVSAPYKRAVSGWLDSVPISVGEALCALGILVLLAGIIITIAQRLRGRRVLLRRLAALLALAVWLYAGVCAFWGVHYYGSSFEQKTGLAARPVSAAELEATARVFLKGVNLSARRAPRQQGLFYAEREEIFAAFPGVYDGAVRQYPCLAGPDRKPKPAAFSRLMSRTGFTGYIFPFTGEITLNVDCPLVFLPVTVAHESAHQRGVGPEQEANFAAVAACLDSGQPLYEYSGWLFGWLHLSNALYQADPEAYWQQWSLLCPAAQADLRANNAYWAQFEGPVREAAESTYTGFLQSYGQTLGMQSYGACVDLLVARYCPDEA